LATNSERIEDLTQFAIEVIRGSGQKALAYYGKGNPRMKFDEELVTEAELHVSQFFEGQLNSRFSDHLFFRNTQEADGYTHGGSRYLWVHDAIDGLANFQGGIPIWGTSLALLENFWPVLGMFYMPVTGDLFYAQPGKGAFLGENPIGVSEQEDMNDESLLLTYSRFHLHYRTTFPGKIRDLGCTAAHMCYVAMGRAEAALIGNESYKDLAAARVIVETAGAKIYTMDGHEVFLNEYLDGQRIGAHLLVSAPDTYAQIRACLEEVS
jgi:myo-inositol-1(or 4)-monophosphatase